MHWSFKAVVEQCGLELLRDIWPNLLLQAGPTVSGCLGSCPITSEYFWAENLFWCFTTLTVIFPRNAYLEFLLLSIALVPSCPARPSFPASARKIWLYFLYTFCLAGCRQQLDLPWTFPSLLRPDPVLSTCLIFCVLQPMVNLVSLHWNLPISFFYQEARNQMQSQKSGGK